MAELMNSNNETRPYGDLLVTMTSNYTWKWNDRGSGSKRNCSIYHPVNQRSNALRPLGSVAFGNYDTPLNKRATLLVGKNPSSSGQAAVAAPRSYTKLWTDRGSGGDYNGAVWRPVAPDGYVALGDVFGSNWDTPSVDAIWCLRSDLVTSGNYSGTAVWNDEGSGAKDSNISFWDVKPVSHGTHGAEKVPMLADCFIAEKSWDKPSNGLARVPVLEVKNQYHTFDSTPPELDPKKLPFQGQIYEKIEQCRVTLPFVAFFQPTDQESLKTITDPFCVISRTCCWKANEIYNNPVRDPMHRTYYMISGISATDSQSFTHSAGVEVSASAGVFGVGLNLSLSYQFTYQQSYDFTEYKEVKKEIGFNISPYTAKVVFARHIGLKGTRANESWVLKEIGLDASDEIHVREVDLPKPTMEEVRN